MFLEGKGLEVFDLCGSLPPLPCSPHVVPSETVSTAESQGQTQQPGEGGGLWNRAGAGRLSLLLEMGATQGPWPRNALGLTRSDPKGSLCPASLGAVQPAGICFPLSMQADAMHPSSTHVLLPGEEDKATCSSCVVWPVANSSSY